MSRAAFVYILASGRNGTLYIGAATNLTKRVWDHKQGVGSNFTSKYGVHDLVYFERHETIQDAAYRERQIKKWKRAWKIKLIEQHNSDWRDLYDEIV